MSVWITQYERSAIAIMAALLIMIVFEKRIATKISSYYTLVLVCSFCAAVLDEIAVITLAKASQIPLFVNYFINMLYIVILNLVYMFYLLYVITVTRLEYKLSLGVKNLIFVPVYIVLAIVLSTPFTGWAFYINENFEYVHGFGFYIEYAVGMLYLAAGLIITIIEREAISYIQRVAFVAFSVAALIGGTLSVVFPYVLMNALITVVGLILVYISMQSQLVDTDDRLGTYNAAALGKQINVSLKKNRDFYLITLKTGGLEHVNFTYGYDVTNSIIKQLAEYMLKNTPSQRVFFLSGALLTAYIEGDEKQVTDYAKLIEERMLRNFRAEGLKNELVLPFSINIIHIPEQGNDAKEIVSLVNYSIVEPTIVDVNHIHFISNEVVENKSRIGKVERAMDNAIRLGNFEVYYQPIINMETGKADSAEALVRLIDEELGEISPGEFIPLAERNGGIAQITEIVLRRVCAFIKSENLEELGIKNIEINLSVADWTLPNLLTRLMPIVKSYDVDPNNIVFEIPEKCKFTEGNNVDNNIKEIREAGFGLALDNYGIEQINTSELIKQNFSKIKIDKTMFWNSIKDDKGTQMFEMFISLMKQYGYDVVVSGVENMMMDDYLIDIGCPYTQGYNYAKPMPESEFIDFVLKRN